MSALTTAMAVSPYVAKAAAQIEALKTLYASPEGQRAATMLSSAYRGYSARKRARGSNPRARTNIGEPKNFASDKKSLQSNGDNVNHDTRTPYSQNLVDIVKATGAQEIDGRLRQTINITGFSIEIMMRNRGASWILANFAVVSPKNQNSDPPSVDGFFREYSTSRDVNFSTALNSNQFHTYPISTDKWRILMHKRYQMAPLANNGAGSWDVGNVNFLKRKLWVPLKRTIVFNDDATDESEVKVFLLFWFDTAEANGGDAAVVNQVYGGVRTVTYFNEVIEVPKRFRIR